jgi:cephalosporin hydroxylase
MVELNASCGGPKDAQVIGIDIDIRVHNHNAIKCHPIFRRITLLQGSSVAEEIVTQVKVIANRKKKILVCLDSNRTHDHVLVELEAYALLTSVGSYCVVMDTAIEDMPKTMFPDRPWGHGDNPKTAV